MVYHRPPFVPLPGTDPMIVLQKLVAERLREQQDTTIRECIAYCEAHATDSGAQIAERLRAELERLRQG